MAVTDLFRASSPAVPVRCVHLDLKGTPPTPQRMLELLDLFAALRYTAVLFEWEDTYPWTVDERFRCETAYSDDDVRAFRARARALNLEFIPLVQCLGHMETPLARAGYEPLREAPGSAQVLNPLAPGATQLIADMIDDLLRLTPDVKHLHLGGDEAWTFGTHPDTHAYVEKHGKGALYLQHVGPLLDRLNARGIRPILWHDMMLPWDDESVRALAQRADLCVWGYHGTPQATGGHHAVKHIERFRSLGVPLWGGTAYKGASGPNVDLPKLALHEENALGWALAAREYDMKGVIATAWSRYSTHNVQCETLDASLDSLVNVAAILHDGEPPAGGREAILHALGDLRERERFERCHAAVGAMAQARGKAWGLVPILREMIAMATVDARRRSGTWMVRWLQDIDSAVRAADATGREILAAYEGLVPSIWMDRYVRERIDPLREELHLLHPRVRQLDPAGYAVEFPTEQVRG